jgi:hypothetical protein
MSYRLLIEKLSVLVFFFEKGNSKVCPTIGKSLLGALLKYFSRKNQAKKNLDFEKLK